MNYRCTIIVMMAFQFVLISMPSLADELQFSRPYAIEYSEKQLLSKIKDFPHYSNSRDKLSIHNKQEGTLFQITYDRTKNTLNAWEVKGANINTGQIEALMKEECIVPNGKAISWFYLWGVSLLKTHMGIHEGRRYPDNIIDIHDFKKTEYLIKVNKIIDAVNTDKKAVLICTPLD